MGCRQGGRCHGIDQGLGNFQPPRGVLPGRRPSGLTDNALTSHQLALESIGTPALLQLIMVQPRCVTKYSRAIASYLAPARTVSR